MPPLKQLSDDELKQLQLDIMREMHIRRIRQEVIQQIENDGWVIAPGKAYLGDLIIEIPVRQVRLRYAVTCIRDSPQSTQISVVDQVEDPNNNQYRWARDLEYRLPDGHGAESIMGYKDNSEWKVLTDDTTREKRIGIIYCICYYIPFEETKTGLSQFLEELFEGATVDDEIV